MTGLIVDVPVNCMPCQMQVTNRFVILFPWEQNLKNRNFKVLIRLLESDLQMHTPIMLNVGTHIRECI